MQDNSVVSANFSSSLPNSLPGSHTAQHTIPMSQMANPYEHNIVIQTVSNTSAKNDTQVLVNPYRLPQAQKSPSSNLVNTVDASSSRTTSQCGSQQHGSQTMTFQQEHQAQMMQAMDGCGTEQETNRLETSAEEDLIVRERYARGKLCCCDKESFVHKFTVATLVVDIILFCSTLCMYFDVIFTETLTDGFQFIYRPEAGLTHE